MQKFEIFYCHAVIFISKQENNCFCYFIYFFVLFKHFEQHFIINIQVIDYQLNTVESGSSGHDVRLNE